MIISKTNEFSFTNTMELLNKKDILYKINYFFTNCNFAITNSFKYCLSADGSFHIGNLLDDVTDNIELKDLILTGIVDFDRELFDIRNKQDEFIESIYDYLIKDIRQRHINYDINVLNDDETALIVSILEYPIKFLSKNVVFDMLDSFTRDGKLIFNFKVSDLKYILDYKLSEFSLNYLYEYIETKIPIDIKSKAINEVINNDILLSTKSETEINKMLYNLAVDNLKILSRIF